MKKFNLILFVICLVTIAWTPLSSQMLTWSARYNGPGGSDDASFLARDNQLNIYVLGQTGIASGSDIVLIKYNQAGDTSWVRKLNGPGESEDLPAGISLDGSGNIYIGATSIGFGTGYDMLLAKYNPSGNMLWSRTYNGTGNGEDRVSDIAASTSGDVYIAGESFNSVTGTDCITMKYNSSGTQQWVKSKNGTANSTDRANDIDLSAFDEVNVLASILNSGTLIDYMAIRYNSSGTELWAKTYNSPGNNNDNAQSIVSDQTGNVYVTGRTFSSATNFDYATVKFNPMGDTLWARIYNGPPGNAADIPRGLKVDNSGNAWVTGYSTGTGSGFDYATIKYNPSGVMQFVKRYNGPGNGNDFGYSIDVDVQGNAYITGQSTGAGTGNDFATIKYNPSGDTVWVGRYNGTGNGSDIARSIKVDNSFNVFVTGQSFGTTNNDIATIKYSQSVNSMTLTAKVFIEAFYNSSSNSMISDTVSFYIKNGSSPYNTVDFKKGLISTAGTGNFNFSNAVNGTNYYLTVTHRNSIETWSALTVAFTAGSLTYDFSTSASKAYGNNQIQVDASPVNYAIYSGDVNQDETVDLSDIVNVYNDANIFASGYLATDVTGDNFVDLSDVTSAFNNANNFVGVVKP